MYLPFGEFPEKRPCSRNRIATNFVECFRNVFLVFFIGACLVARPQTTHAALYNASGELGQYDAIGSVKSFTKSGADNGASISAQGFRLPGGLALDSSNHRLFVDDRDNYRVLVYQLDTNNKLTSNAAAFVLGQNDFSSRVITTTQSGFNQYPGGITYDAAGNRLFVADSLNNRVLVFNVTTSTIANGENAQNVLGQANFTSLTASTTQSGFFQPFALAYDPINKRLFVGDGGNDRVLVFDAATSTIANGENAQNVLGQVNFTSVVFTTVQNRLNGGINGLVHVNTVP